MPPLLLSDCRALALVDEHATVDWLCAPRLDSPAILASLLDPERGGAFEVIVEGSEPAGQRYQDATMTVETDLRGPDGLVRVIDCLTMDRRGPAGTSEPGELVRQVHVLEGSARVFGRLELRYGFGLQPVRWNRQGRRTRAVGAGPTIELDCELPLRPVGVSGVLSGGLDLQAGAVRTMAIRWQDPVGLGTDVRARADTSADWWRAWSAPVREGSRREAILLKALTFAPTGGLVRSATTSLADPAADGRLCWPEDARAGAAAFESLGLDDDAARLRAWLEAAGAGDAPRGLAGEEARAETTLDHLVRPVVVGAPAGDTRGNLPYAPDLIAALA